MDKHQQRVQRLRSGPTCGTHEGSATRLTEIAQRVRDEFSGDLREIAQRSQHDIAAAAQMLKQFKGISNTGADIYLREVQDVWRWVRPYFDDRATAAAKELGLPSDPAKLGALAPRSNARLAAALVRASLDSEVRRPVTGQLGDDCANRHFQVARAIVRG